MNLYFVRHGESEANTFHVISNREQPHALTARGREQAEVLARNLANVPITAIFSSPILRARQTAEVLAVAFGIPYQVADALREYDCGILEDQFDEESWRMHREYFEDWTLRCKYENKPEGGESFIEIRERFLPFLESLKKRSDEHILLVGHGGLFHLMLPLVLTNIDRDFVKSRGIGHTETVIAELLTPEGFICRQWGIEILNKDEPPAHHAVEFPCRD